MTHELRPALLGVLHDLPNVAMIAYDRYLGVVGATRAAKALHPIYTPGTNIARFTYLDGATNPDLADWGQKADFIAATLRSSLTRHPEDDKFLDLVGQLIAGSEVFAESWARTSAAANESAILIRHPEEGDMWLNQRQFPLGAGSEDTLVIWTGADDESTGKLGRLSR